MLLYLRRLLAALRWLAKDDQIAIYETMREQFDALKSSLEVSPEMVADFQAWKAAHPLPTHPQVSVLICTYNRARLLVERAVPSVLAQTYQDFELIIVGDGCTDETAELLARISDRRVRFTNLPTRGNYPTDSHRRWLVQGMQAVNYAFTQARGDYITQLDDDDEYPPERLEKLVKFAVANQCDIVWHPFWYETAEGRWRINRAEQFAYKQVTSASLIYRRWFNQLTGDYGAHLLLEPGDWHRLRRMKYVNPVMMRYPEPLLRHYRERTQAGHNGAAQTGS